MLHKRLTSNQTAKIIGIKSQTLRVWRMSGKGPRFHRYGERYSRAYYDPDEVQRWLDKHTFAHTSEETVNQLTQNQDDSKRKEKEHAQK